MRKRGPHGRGWRERAVPAKTPGGISVAGITRGSSIPSMPPPVFKPHREEEVEVEKESGAEQAEKWEKQRHDRASIGISRWNCILPQISMQLLPLGT